MRRPWARPGARRTSRQSSTCRKGSSTRTASRRSASCAPTDEPGLVVARRVTADGRSRAYAWGRSVAREDVVAATERLLALSGQFAQRRLARHDVPARAPRRVRRRRAAGRGRPRRASAWRALQAASRRLDELEHGADAERARLAELEALVEDTEGLEPGRRTQLRGERERIRHVAELGEGAAARARSARPGRG